MKLLSESYIFQMNNTNGILSDRMKKVAAGKDITILNDKLETQIENMKKLFKDAAVVKMVNAIIKGELILFCSDPIDKLPNYIPFMKFKDKTGKIKVAVDLTTDIVIYKTRLDDEVSYNIDIKKLLCLCMPAFICLRIADKTTALPAGALEIGSRIWAKMINKVLERNIALNTNRERYEAFMYFAIKFFLINMIEAPVQVAENIATGYLKNGKTYTINTAEAYVKGRDIDMYQNIASFMSVLFNNEATNIHGIRTGNSSLQMNFSFYVQRFVQMYDKRALLAIDQFPYFIFALFASQNHSFLVSDRSFEDVCLEKEYGKFMSSIYSIL